jgi:hypothetical protein
MARLRKQDYCIPIVVHHSEIVPSNKPGFHVNVPLPHSLRAHYTLLQRAYKQMKECEASCSTARSEATLSYRELRHSLAKNRRDALQVSFEASTIEYYVKIGRLDPSLDLRASEVYVNILRDWTVYFMAGPRRPDRGNQ